MKSIALRIVSLVALAAACSSAQTTATYANFIRQVQLSTNVKWDVSVAAAGERVADLSLEDGGARFELWTIKSSPLTEYKLDEKTVGAYLPRASVDIISRDPYGPVPRTRVNEPFDVVIKVNGLTNGANDPLSARRVNVYHHYQSYGLEGLGLALDRLLATLFGTTAINGNGTPQISSTVTRYSILPSKTGMGMGSRGEERFSVYSASDVLGGVLGGALAPQLASKYIQVWPLTRGEITGVKTGETYRNKIPPVIATAWDIYPASNVYLYAYNGEPKVNMADFEKMDDIDSAQMPNVENVPKVKDTRVASDVASYIPESGDVTVELVSKTPFGWERVVDPPVTFKFIRSMKVNGMLGTME